MPVQVGQTLGRYRIDEEIGAGGMGVVYRVRDERLGRILAIKVLKPGLLSEPASRKRFRNEALMLSKLNHPAIQVIHDFDEIDGTDYLVTELVPGVSLDERVRTGPLPEKEVVRIGAQLAQGLAAAHAAGVLHRDLKPANLRVSADRHLKILDFGLATLSNEAILQMSRTLSASDVPSGVAGTLPYMSPEQLLGNEVDERSDIYSAGVVIYELSTGQLPFRDQLVPKLTDSIVHQKPAPPSSLNPKVSAEMERIILKCLEKDAELRYQSAKDLAADLGRMELIASSETASVPSPRSSTTKIALVVAAIAIIAGIALIVVLISPQLRRDAISSKEPLTFEQLTNFADSATSPALSPDGKMLTFIRGENTFVGPGQIYVKLLPNGEPVQLTHDDLYKMSPVFFPSGDRIAYTTEAPSNGMDTWVLPALGGQPSPMLANASGLTWLGGGGESSSVLFSEWLGEGIHEAIVTARENRSDERRIYVPADANGMAHRSYASPDGKSVLIVEMDLGGWRPCRLVPFDGKSLGKAVGPAGAVHRRCLVTGWELDVFFRERRKRFSCLATGIS